MNKLIEYIDMDQKAISTTEAIKTSFKKPFEVLDKEGFVLLKNSRRENKMILMDLNKYAEQMKELESLKEKLFDQQVLGIIENDKSEIIDLSDL